jgi:putative transposase
MQPRSSAVLRYFRFALSLHIENESLASRGVVVSHETVRQWALKFGHVFANLIQRRLPRAGGKWILDEAMIKPAALKHWSWRAVGQNGMMLDILMQGRRHMQTAKCLLRNPSS